MAINRDKVLEAAQKYVERKKYDKAVVEYQRLIEADPNDARTLLKIGDLQAKQVLYADAISTYETVGKLYAHQGFALKAIAVYKQIREIIAKHVPQLEERYLHIAPKLAELYQQLGLTSDALAALDEVATRLQRQQKDPEAIEVFRRIVELDPTNPLPHLRLAEAFSRVRDTEGAVFEFKTAASQLAGIGRRDDALKVLERLLHHKPDAEQARICAELYLARGQPQDGMQALSKLQICFQANPRDFDTLSLLARAFNAIGQGTKAIEVQKEMARVARDAGKQELFREIVERLSRVAPNDDGVRKLASQLSASTMGTTGSNAAALAESATYGSSAVQTGRLAAGAAMQGYEQPAPNQGYGQPPPRKDARPGSQPQHEAPRQPPPRPPSAPGFNSLPRPMTAARFPPSPPPNDAEELEELEELAYDYEEVDAEEVLEEVAQAEAYEAEREATAAAPAYVPPNESAYESGGYDVTDANAYAQPVDQSYGVPDYGGRGEAIVNGGDGFGTDQRLEPAPDTADQIQKAIDDASAFRRVRLFNKALETLRRGLDIDPRSMDIHEIYRDILIESGQTEDAVQEMLLIASLYIDSLDGDSAARALQDVLAFDPQNARALQMLQELGYEIVDENEEIASNDRTGGGGYDAEEEPEESLPAYDREESRTARSSLYADERHVFVARASQTEGASVEAFDGAEALPSFPLDEPDADMPSVYAETFVESPPVDADAGWREADAPRAPSAAPVEIRVPSIGAASSHELEDALDEAEFFCSRGLFDDARAILHEQLGKYPNHPLLRERIGELDAQDEQRGSGARERPRAEPDRAYDIATSLDALESLDYDGIEPAEGHAEGDQQVDVEEVFAKFKEGVAKQISLDDSDSHYNLGIAYKEMMLIDDAIREFEVAAQDPKRECVCRSMIGMVEIERGRLNEAIEAFLMGLNSPNKDPQQETVLCYEVGAAYEAKKMNKEALSYYQKAMRRDPNYRDVQERVRRLAKNESKASMRQAAVGADDEFDRAFDDLLSKA